MKSQHVFLMIASAALFGWFAPDFSDAADTADTADSDSLAVIEAGPGVSRRGASRPEENRWGAEQTVLERQRDGHFYANVIVEQDEYRFLVDTGASIVALTGQDAQEMGLFWDENSLRQIGRGASGPVYGVPVTIARMELGAFEARNVKAAIVPEGLGISLLGQSFLSRIKDVKISGNEMRLGE
ncbi:MAG: TIGR02281 family clan AA aspartic protease [Novosphingobium sp.]|nr:TIGR02281 family clan AA aspartic protease [Novosphingobium sp.]